MAEYIEREELLELYCTGNTVIDEVGVVPLQVIRQNIMDMPAQDVAPVVHGRWIPFHSEAAGDIQYCSACGIGFDAKMDYCPHCGAKMDGGNENV